MWIRAGVWLTVPLLLAGAAQRRERARDETSKTEGAAAIRQHFESYKKIVKAPNGEKIDLTPVLRRIAYGKTLHEAGLREHDGDGTVFLNLPDRDARRRPLPQKPRG